MKIPLNRTYTTGKELEYIKQSIQEGCISSDGKFTRKCSSLIEKRMGVERVFLTTSCTAALEMSAILCNIAPGDEVILPSFSFVSTGNAFLLRGAKLIFVDIRADTLNIDESRIQQAITPKTKAIVPVHYGGVACEMDPILDLASKNNLLVVEDAAHAVDCKYRDRYLGTLGDLGVFSFHESKNYICGEGGAILINNNELIDRAEILGEKGTNRARFFRGEIDRYEWLDLGSSYLPSDLLSAFLHAQLECMDEINERRKKIYWRYHQELSSLAEDGKIQLPVIPDRCIANHHLFYVLTGDRSTRDSLLNHLNSRGIGAAFHYSPLHLSPVGRSMGYSEGQLPITESVSKRIIRLPLFNSMSMEQQLTVTGEILYFFNQPTGKHL